MDKALDEPSQRIPFFLIGAERSGTTLLRLMLDHHPALAWNSEFEYAVDALPPEGGWPDLHTYYEMLAASRIFQDSGYTIDRSLSYPDLVKSFLAQKKAGAAKAIVGATVHRHFDQIARIWPDASYIYLLRDGRDVSRSNIGMGWAGTVWFGVERWMAAERDWARMKEELPESRRIEVRYEDIVCDPVTELTRICAFIGIPYDEAMMGYPENSTYDHPDPSLTQQWRTKMSELDIRIVEARIGPMLAERGYELSGLPPLEVTPEMIAEFRREDRRSRIAHRVGRYGWPLLLAEVITRKSGLKPLWRPVKRRMSAIDRTHLK